MYEDFSADYDRFVDWKGRLATEMPFLERRLQDVDAHRVLDAACGTGMHAIALARRGYAVVGADASEGMIEQARANAGSAEDFGVRFETAGFGTLQETLGLRPAGGPDRQVSTPKFDAILCLGNSLPHVLTPTKLAATLEDFAACLRPRGLLLIQNRNFDRVLANHDRWMGPQGYREEGAEWLFLRFYDFDPDDLLTFNMIRLRREDGQQWKQAVGSTRLWPLTKREATAALESAGFSDITCYGDMEGKPYDPESSPNLVLAASRVSQSDG